MEDWKYNLYCRLVRNDPDAFTAEDIPCALSRNDINTYKRRCLLFRINSDGYLEQQIADKEDVQILLKPVVELPEEPVLGVDFRIEKQKTSRWVRVVKASEKGDWLRRAHCETLHQGRDACLAVLKPQIYWFGMKNDLVEFIRCCDTCQRTRTDYTVAPLQHIIEERPNVRWQIDFTTLAGYQGYLLVVIDVFSKYVWWKFLATKEASGVTSSLLNIFRKEGSTPKIIQSDNGGEFISEAMNEITAEFGIEVIHGRPYHPQSQGNVERVNKTLKAMIYKLIRASKEQGIAINFHKLLEDVVDTYNTTSHSSTGFTPLQLQRPVLRSPPASQGSTQEIRADQRLQLAGLFARAHRHLKAAADKADKVHNKKHAKKLRIFAVGDHVLYKIPKELRKKGQAAYDCEAEITAVHRNSRYSLKFLSNPPPKPNRTFHANEIKKFYEPSNTNIPASSAADPNCTDASANSSEKEEEEEILQPANNNEPLPVATEQYDDEDQYSCVDEYLSNEVQDHLDFLIEARQNSDSSLEIESDDEGTAVNIASSESEQDFVRYQPRARTPVPRASGSLSRQFQTLSESPKPKKK